jgi:hypothetical protein
MSGNKYWLLGTGALLGILCLLAVLYVTAQNPRVDKEAADLKETRIIAHNGENIMIPAPPGYCFLDEKQEMDRIVLDVMRKMQADYGNHLWLAYAECGQLETVRASQDMNAYMNSGMVVTPLPLLELEMPASVVTSTLRERIKTLNPATVEDLINKAAHKNLSPLANIKTGQPLIYEDNGDSLLFLINHEMKNAAGEPNARLTEFDIATSIKNRPLVAIFIDRNLTDPGPKQEFTKAYLTDLRSANP